MNNETNQCEWCGVHSTHTHLVDTDMGDSVLGDPMCDDCYKTNVYGE
jgi:hypothetical protein